MASWSEMSVGARAGAVAGAAAVVVVLLYGLWSQRPAPAPEAVPEATAVTPAPAAEAAATPAPEAAAETTAAATAAPSAETAAEAPAPEATAAAEPAAEAAAAPAEATPTPTPAPAAEAAASPAPDATAAAPSASPAPADAAAAPAAPVFDLVRVQRDGSAVVAGSGAADATISLRIDGEQIVSVPADGTGKFVALFNLPPSEAPRLLSMIMVLADGTEVPSEQTVAIAPTLAPAAPEAVASAEAGAGTAEQPAATPEPVAPAALLVTPEGAKVLQSTDVSPEMAANVTIDSISYSAEGDVQLAGRGTAGSVVRAYLDNGQVGDGLVDDAGSWGLTLFGIAPGLYTLRIDQLDGAGKVTSRFETPFKRETDEALAAAAAAGAEAEAEAAVAAAEPAPAATEAEQAPAAAPAAAPGPVSITVQPGFTLWRIARESLGEGVLYVQVFEANKAQIKDPNLIYPGQVFTIPKP